jgi:hypothetical protein
VALFTHVICSQNTVHFMTASMVHATNRVTPPGSDNPMDRYDTKRRVRALRMDDSLTRGEVIGIGFSRDAQNIVVQYGDSVSFGGAV